MVKRASATLDGLSRSRRWVSVRTHYLIHFSYETTLRRHFLTIGAFVAASALFVLLLFHFARPSNSFNVDQVSAKTIVTATINTLARMFVAYLLALVIAIPLSLLIVRTPTTQRILLPIADVIQSVPVLAFFPVIVVFFTAYHAYEPAAIFIIFVTMLWNIVFPVVGGLQTIPEDVTSVAIVFNVRGWKKLWYITLPAIFPFIVTGSLLAWAQGWTIVIVAEVLHTYIPHGDLSQDLLGLGSLLVDSTAQGRNAVFLVTLVTIILIVVLINVFVWQPLLHLAHRFKFD